MPLTKGAQVGEYRLLEPLGRGGMASSWLAVGPDGQEVVLKFPDTTQLGDPVVFERFRREVRIGQRLSHPAIPKALAIREDGQPPYLVMEYVRGELLSAVLQRRHRLSWDEAAALMQQLLQVLAYIHAQGICHRDLKPENLVLTPEGRLKIIDFGIALVGGRPRVTWRGFSGLAGTPQYMAPEQIRGERGSALSDVYAAGAIFYEMLTGRPPFTGDNPLAVMYQALNAEAAPVSRLAAVPPGADAVLARALHRDKGQRFPSAEAFAAAIAAPDTVTPPPGAPRPAGTLAAGRWWAQPLLWLGVLAVGTAAVTAMAVWYFQHR